MFSNVALVPGGGLHFLSFLLIPFFILKCALSLEPHLDSLVPISQPYHWSSVSYRPEFAAGESSCLTMAPPFLSTPEEYQKLIDSVDTFLLDCDGVIYHGSNVPDGVRETLSMLRTAGAFESSVHLCSA